MRRADPSGDMPFVENLWSFALNTYQKPEVARLCLQWQDAYGADINLLLTAAWLAAEQKTWTLEVVAALERHCAAWRRYGVLPLRAVRRGVNGSELYSILKALELEAERLQLAMIEGWLAEHPLPIAGPLPAQCVAINLQEYARSKPLVSVPAALVDELIARL